MTLYHILSDSQRQILYELLLLCHVKVRGLHLTCIADGFSASQLLQYSDDHSPSASAAAPTMHKATFSVNDTCDNVVNVFLLSLYSWERVVLNGPVVYLQSTGFVEIEKVARVGLFWLIRILCLH